MIVQYYRPESMDEALELLARKDLPIYPLGGGSVLSQPTAKRYAVVDLQRLELDQIVQDAKGLHLGATATLQALVDSASLFPALRNAAKRETNFNLRQTATLAGTIVSASGRSPLVTALLALDAKLVWLPGEAEIPLGEFLATREARAGGLLIREVRLPVGSYLGFAEVARTPADVPIICAAVATWADGRIRAALGGPGSAPRLVSDGLNSEEAEDAAYNAYSHLSLSSNESKNYLQNTSRLLVRRLLAESKSG